MKASTEPAFQAASWARTTASSGSTLVSSAAGARQARASRSGAVRSARTVNTLARARRKGTRRAEVSMGSKALDCTIEGDDFQYVRVALAPGEALRAEPGSFLWMDPGIEMDT